MHAKQEHLIRNGFYTADFHCLRLFATRHTRRISTYYFQPNFLAMCFYGRLIFDPGRTEMADVSL